MKKMNEMRASITFAWELNDINVVDPTSPIQLPTSIKYLPSFFFNLRSPPPIFTTNSKPSKTFYCQFSMAEKGVSPVEDMEGGRWLRMTETLLRLSPVGLCVAALVVMLKTSQSNYYGSVSYSDLGGFKYLVHANGICAGYSLLSAVVSAVPRPSTMSRAWTFFCLDQLLTYMILAAGAVSTEVVYLAYHGDPGATWSRACGSFDGFCSKARASVFITFGVVACYVVLSLISSYRLFSKYDAPKATSSPISKPEKSIEGGVFSG